MPKLFLKILIIIETILFPILSCAEEEKDLVAYSRLTSGVWQIWVMDLKNSAEEQITASQIDKRCPIWLENGKKIIYRTNNAEIFMVDLDTKKETQMLKSFGAIMDPAWSDANKLLLFTRYEGYLKDESEVWSVGLNGEDPKILTREAGLQYYPAWSPEGKRIAYTSGKSFGTHEIWLMDKDGKNAGKLTQNTDKYDIEPSFSHNGEKIVFSSNRNGSFDIWCMDKEGKALKNLTESAALDIKPSFSPDDKMIVFTSARSGSLKIWIMDADGANQRQLTDSETECQDAAWIRVR